LNNEKILNKYTIKVIIKKYNNKQGLDIKIFYYYFKKQDNKVKISFKFKTPI